MDDVLDDARAALAWADHGGTSPVAATAMAGLLADVLFQRGHPGEAQRRYQEAALLAAEPGDRCRWLRLAAGAASTRNVGGDTVDLLLQSADTALASGAADDAAHDLAAAAALQYRAPGIIRRPIDGPAVDAQLTRARAISQGGARAEAAIAIAAGWAPGATVRSTELTEQAMRLAGRSDDPLLIVEAFDQLSALELDAGHLDAAEAVIERRLAAITDVPIEPRSGFEHFDTLQMACRVKLAVGKLVEARHYADAIAALPYFREQRHIGLGRRIEVDALAGDFEVVVANAELFERDWRRAGRPVAGNLAIGAYAAAMVHGMLGDTDARDRWIEITRALLPSPERFEPHANLWRVTLDAFLALHLGQPHVAIELLGNAPEPRGPVDQPEPERLAALVHRRLGGSDRARRPSRRQRAIAACRPGDVRQRHRRHHRRARQGAPRATTRTPRHDRPAPHRRRVQLPSPAHRHARNPGPGRVTWRRGAQTHRLFDAPGWTAVSMCFDDAAEEVTEGLRHVLVRPASSDRARGRPRWTIGPACERRRSETRPLRAVDSATGDGTAHSLGTSRPRRRSGFCAVPHASDRPR